MGKAGGKAPLGCMNNLDAVFETIDRMREEKPHPLPSPSLEGEGVIASISLNKQNKKRWAYISLQGEGVSLPADS